MSNLDESDVTLKKLMGLKELEERVWFISFGYGSGLYNHFKLYFKRKEDALIMFEAISGANFTLEQNEAVHDKNYSNSKYFHWMTNGDVMLGSEIIEIYPDKNAAVEAGKKYRAELDAKDKEVEEVLVEEPADPLPDDDNPPKVANPKDKNDNPDIPF